MVAWACGGGLVGWWMRRGEAGGRVWGGTEGMAMVMLVMSCLGWLVKTGVDVWDRVGCWMRWRTGSTDCGGYKTRQQRG